jgi:Spy/CpxP family protein refolding chaperone
MKEMHKGNREQVAAILTPEQRKLMHEQRRQGRDGCEGRDGERCEQPETPPPAK